MSRYFVPIAALLLSCGSAQFSPHQDQEGEDADAAAEHRRSSKIEDTEIMAESLERGSNSLAGQMVNDENMEMFPISIVDRKLDILMVIDNSTSMNLPNTQLSEKLTPLLSKISVSDWQIVVTTSMISDCLRGILKKGKHGNEEFKEIVSKVHANYLSKKERALSGNEQVVKMATRALHGMPLATNAGHYIDLDCSGTTQHWLRPDSLLVVLMITDEDADDHSHLPQNRCEDLVCIDTFYQKLSSLREPHVSAKVYGILDKRKNGSGGSFSVFSRQNRSDLYLEWRDEEEGKPLFDYHHALYTGSEISDLGVVLEKISTNMYSALQNVFILQNTYHESNTKVSLIKSDNSTIQLSPNVYTLSNKTLVIDRDQLAGAVLVKIERLP